MRALGPPSAITVGCLALALGAACGDQAEVPSGASTTTGSGLAGGPPGQGGEGGGGGAGGDAGGADGGHGGARPAVLVGLDANPAALGAEPATFAQRFEAAAAAHAAGARVSSLSRAWSAIDDAALGEDALLARAGCEPGAPCRPVAYSLLVVEGPADRRPDELVGEAWDAVATRSALEDAIGRVLGAFGEDLAVLSLGARTEAWFVEHPADAAPLGVLLQGAAAAALERGPSGLLVGVGLSHEAVLSEEGPGAGLRALGNALTVSLAPGAADDPVPPPAAVAPTLDALAALAAGRPVALLGASYPTSAELTDGEGSQATFVDALFGAVDGRRAAFPIVTLSRLHDLGDEACDAEGARTGEDDARTLAYRCSSGLRAADGAPKAAWPRFLAGAAKLASSGTGPEP